MAGALAGAGVGLSGIVRILMYMPGLSPGSLGWQVHLDFADAVRSLGHGFEIVTSTQSHTGVRVDDAAGSVRTSAPFARWNPVSRWAAPLLRTANLLPWASALARYLALHGKEFDLLHVEVAYPHATAAVLGARWANWKGPIAITPMGEDVLVLRDAHYGFRRHWLPRLLVRGTLRRAQAVRCISGAALRAVRAIAPRARSEVIPLNVTESTAAAAEVDDHAARERRREARARISAELGLGDRPLVLALGRLHPFKGIPGLIDAMTHVRGEAVLVVAGPSLSGKAFGDHAAAVRAHADEAGLGERFRWIGAVEPDRALELLCAADVLVVPSLLESLNKVCVEAAAVRTPFVVTATTGIAEWVPPSGVGLVVPPRDPATLASAIERVLGGGFIVDPAACRAFVSRFAPRRVAAEVVRFYESEIFDSRRRA